MLGENESIINCLDPATFLIDELPGKHGRQAILRHARFGTIFQRVSRASSQEKNV